MTVTDDYSLSLDAFIRSFAVNRGSPYAMLLGAGASISSGVISAQQCIWEWKRSIFLSQNPGLERQFSELSLPGVRTRIQEWLDSTHEHPPRDDPSEYEHYIERCYPIEHHRRRYFQDKIQKATPHAGYRLLCFLAELRMVRSVWTTNFDGLAGKAAVNASVDPIEVGIDSAESRLPRQPREGELLCVSLHGDYRYDRLMNTSAELQEQDKRVRDALVEELKHTSCICVGYSGRDASVMGALTDAVTQSGTGDLYWCTYGDSEPPGAVLDLIGKARDSGREAYLVPTNGFDDLMVRLARHVSGDAERESISSVLAEYTEEQRLDRSTFTLPEYPTGTVIKSNAFRLDCPSEVYAFGLKEWPQEQIWQWFRDQTQDYMLVAVPLGGQVLAIGLLDDVRQAFGDNIEGDIQRSPLQDRDYRYEDGAVMSMLTGALASVLAHDAGVNTDRRRMLWETTANGNAGPKYPNVLVFDAVELSVRTFDEKSHLVLKPTLYLENNDGSRPEPEMRQRILFDKLGGQYNAQFNDAVNKWRKCLLGAAPGHRDVEVPPGAGSTFRFRIRRTPVFADVGDPVRQRPVDISKMPSALLKQRGVAISEPDLLFARHDASGNAKDSHPIRGILNNRPYDVSLTQSGFDQTVRAAVICPEQEQRSLYEYLHKNVCEKPR